MKKNKYPSKKKIKYSVDPHIINAGLQADMIEEGMDLWENNINNNNK